MRRVAEGEDDAQVTRRSILGMFVRMHHVLPAGPSLAGRENHYYAGGVGW